MKPLVRQKRRRRIGAVSLVESMLSILLLSLILVGVVNLVVMALRSYSKINDVSSAVEKSQSVSRNVESEMTKGFLAIMPNDAAPFPVWKTSTLGAASNYTYTNSSVTVQAAVYLVYPGTRSLTVYSTSGGTITLSGSTAINDRSKTSPTESALIYRGNTNGTVNPSSGTVLWIKRFSSGVQASNTVITNKIHTAWNAVNFKRPTTRYDSVQMTIVTGAQTANRGWSSNHTTATSSGVTNSPVRNLVLLNATSSYNIVVP